MTRMVQLTKEQRKALKRVFDRGPIEHTVVVGTVTRIYTTTYREFRKTVQPMFGGDKCVLVHWRNMWLGIEPDGHTHS